MQNRLNPSKPKKKRKEKNKKSQKNFKTIRKLLNPLALKTQTRTSKLFSPIERRKMRPLNRYNIGRNLSSRKKLLS